MCLSFHRVLSEIGREVTRKIGFAALESLDVHACIGKTTLARSNRCRNDKPLTDQEKKLSWKRIERLRKPRTVVIFNVRAVMRPSMRLFA